MKRKLAVLALSLGLTALACQLVAGIERVDKTDPLVEAGPDVVVETDAAIPDPCAHVRPLRETKADDAPNDSLPDIYLALREVTLVPAAGATLGYDLDEACTCDKRPGAAFDGGPSCVTTRPAVCDADGGVDNQAANVLSVYSTFIDLDKAANINGRIAEGKQTSIVLLRNYNGRANDSAVSFGIFTSEGMLEGPTCPGSTTVDGVSTPGWCGEDKWTASASTVDSAGNGFLPKSLGTGYVVGFRFVVELKGAASVPFGGYRLTLGSPIASGRLVPLDENLVPVDTSQGPALDRIKHWRIEDSVLSGRIPASELLAAAGTIFASGDAGGPRPPLCTTSLFSLLKQQVCDSIDISASKASTSCPRRHVTHSR
jgi:hypothetical protein